MIRVQETIRPVYSVDFDEDLRRGGYEFIVGVKANYIEESIAEKFEVEYDNLTIIFIN